MTDKSTLVLKPDQQPVLTDLRETDVRTALTRGLKDYLETLSIDMPGGRQVRFKKVLEVWGVAEIPAEYPSAAVIASDPLGYGEDGEKTPMSPVMLDSQVAPGVYIVRPNECVMQLVVQCWCTDPQERMAVCAMLEDAFVPVDWMYGFRLVLPHYHGVFGEYEMGASDYEDSETNAQRRYRKVTFVVTARVDQVRLFARKRLKPRIALEMNPAELDPPTAEQAAASRSEPRTAE